MEPQTQGRVVVITGASSGIGRATTLETARACEAAGGSAPSAWPIAA